MAVDLTFWQEYGPFIISIVLGIVIGAGVVLFSGVIARTYEKTMVKEANHYWDLKTGAQQRRRDKTADSIAQLQDKARSARTMQRTMLYISTAFVSYHLARMYIGMTSVEGWARWGVLVLGVLACVGIAYFLEHRASTHRAARLSAQIDLRKREIPTT